LTDESFPAELVIDNVGGLSLALELDSTNIPLGKFGSTLISESTGLAMPLVEFICQRDKKWSN